MKATFHALAQDRGGRLQKSHAVELLRQGVQKDSASQASGLEAAELLWAEMGLTGDDFITEVCLPVQLLLQFLHAVCTVEQL